MKIGTRLVSYDQAPQDPYNPMATPIYQTATFEQENADRFGAFDYSRSGNPTRRVLEDQIARLENGTHGFAFASGMAAIVAVLRLLRTGDEILADSDLYGGTSRLLGSALDRGDIKVKFFDATNPDSLAERITPGTKLVYVESPTNPLLRVADIRKISEIVHASGLPLCVDSTAMSPYLQNPLSLGADIVVHSGTKYLCGHSDVTAGLVAVQDAALASRLAFIQNSEGSALGPFDSYLLLRGLKTLKLRLDAQEKSARKIVEFLKTHSGVKSINYPGDENHPQYSLQKEQARGAGSLLSFRVGSHEAAINIAERTSIIKIAVSFGSVNSTISVPAKMSHASVPHDHREHRELPDDLLRLSVGAEDVDDLIDDLANSMSILTS